MLWSEARENCTHRRRRQFDADWFGVTGRRDRSGLISLRWDLTEDATVTDEHNDQRYEEDDNVDEGEVRLAVADGAPAKDGLANCFVCDNVYVVNGKLWNWHQRRDCPTNSSHRHRLRNNKNNYVKIVRWTFIDCASRLFCFTLLRRRRMSKAVYFPAVLYIFYRTSIPDGGAPPPSPRRVYQRLDSRSRTKTFYPSFSVMLHKSKMQWGRGSYPNAALTGYEHACLWYYTVFQKNVVSNFLQ